jgi:hypothetical protein
VERSVEIPRLQNQSRPLRLRRHSWTGKGCLNVPLSSTLLSPRLLVELRSYWRLYQPKDWLFPSKVYPDRPLTTDAVLRAFTGAVERVGLPDRGGIHSLRQNAARREMPSGVA